MPRPLRSQNDKQKLYTAIVVPVEPLDEESEELIEELLIHFTDVVNVVIGRLLKGDRNIDYKEFQKDFHSKVPQQAIKVAWEHFKSYLALRELYEHGLLDGCPSVPRVTRLFARIWKWQAVFLKRGSDLILRISVKPRKYAFLRVHVTKQLESFVPILTSNDRKSFGELTIFLRGDKLMLAIPFKVEKREYVTSDAIIPIDFNENSIDLLLFHQAPAIIRLFTYLKVLREKYERIREKLQSAYGKTAPLTKHGKRLKELLAKYGSREANRVREILKYTVHTIIALAWLTGATVIREFLKHFNRIAGMKLLSYRLSTLPVLTFREMLDSKSAQHGVRLIQLTKRETMNTSRECPRCGKIATRVNSEYAKCGCGCEFNPQISAPFIIAKRKSLLRIIKWPKKLEYNEKQVIIRIPMKRLANASIEEAIKNPIKYYRFIRITIKELKNPIIVQLVQSGTQVLIKKILEVDIRKTLWLAPLRLAAILLELAK